MSEPQFTLEDMVALETRISELEEQRDNAHAREVAAVARAEGLLQACTEAGQRTAALEAEVARLREELATERAAHEATQSDRDSWKGRAVHWQHMCETDLKAAEQRVTELERERAAAFRKGFEACELGEPLSPNRLKERALDRLERDLAEANATIDRETNATVHWLRRAEKAEALLADKELVLERYAQLKDDMASARRLLELAADCWAENEEAEFTLRDVEEWLRAHPEPATPAAGTLEHARQAHAEYCDAVWGPTPAATGAEAEKGRKT